MLWILTGRGISFNLHGSWNAYRGMFFVHRALYVSIIYRTPLSIIKLVLYPIFVLIFTKNLFLAWFIIDNFVPIKLVKISTEKVARTNGFAYFE